MKYAFGHFWNGKGEVWVMTRNEYGHCSEEMPVFSIPGVLTIGQCQFVRYIQYKVDMMFYFPLYFYHFINSYMFRT